MNLSITSHFHLVKNRKKAIALLKAISPKYIRVSSVQREVMDGGAVRALVYEGFRVIPVINGDRAGKLTDKQWRDYVVKASNLLPVLGIRQAWVIQIGNEWNTERFWGAQPDAKAALARFKVAADIIRSRHSAILLTPGVTCENKNGAGKMKARDFLQYFVEHSAPANFYALHYYQSDRKQAKVFEANCKYIIGAGQSPTITETGGDIDWYSSIAERGFDSVSAGFCAWYCFNGHPGFQIVSDSLQSSNIYNAMKEDT